MKKIILFFSILIVLQSKSEAQYRNEYISFQNFYDQLAPYGTWVFSPGYGYVWSPDVDRYFKPYASNGDWVYTNYGWTWVSNYRWGWAPFHYGRWVYDDWRGWLWVPGYDWAPAWVTWGYYGGNYGWAPLAPGINVSVNSGWRAPSGWWTFVPDYRFGSSNWNRYVVHDQRNVIVNNITVINNVYNNNQAPHRAVTAWMRGPEVRDVERVTNTRVRTMEVADVRNPSADRVVNNRVSVYRPAVERKTEARPMKIGDINQLRPVTQFPANDRKDNAVRPVRPSTAGTATPATPGISARPSQATPVPVQRSVNQQQGAQPVKRDFSRPAEPQTVKPESKPAPATRPTERAGSASAPRRSAS